MNVIKLAPRAPSRPNDLLPFPPPECVGRLRDWRTDPPLPIKPPPGFRRNPREYGRALETLKWRAQQVERFLPEPWRFTKEHHYSGTESYREAVEAVRAWMQHILLLEVKGAKWSPDLLNVFGSTAGWLHHLTCEILNAQLDFERATGLHAHADQHGVLGAARDAALDARNTASWHLPEA